VVERQGLFCALYSDRASHFFVTPQAGGAVDKTRLTQVGRALKELGVQLIPAYSPQARGRMERSYRTWQNRLPQELRLAGITRVEEANRFLRERYIAEFNARFQVAAAEPGTAFRPCTRSDLDWVFTVQTERVASKDNTVAIGKRWWQLEKCRWRYSLAGTTVTIHEHLDGTVSIRYGPHVVGRYDGAGQPLSGPATKSGRGKAGPAEDRRPLEIASGDSHFPTAAATTIPPRSSRKKKRVA
jgi:hypothetical protein